MERSAALSVGSPDSAWRDYVVGITRDALVVEYVQVHEVLKAGP